MESRDNLYWTCVGGSCVFTCVKLLKLVGKREEGKHVIFLAGKPVCMEDSSSSEALASVRETTPFVRDKQRTREMNYICAIGSRIMKMIDRYLFDIGKFSCHTMFFLYPRQCHPASSCNRCATQNTNNDTVPSI